MGVSVFSPGFRAAIKTQWKRTENKIYNRLIHTTHVSYVPFAPIAYTVCYCDNVEGCRAVYCPAAPP